MAARHIVMIMLTLLILTSCNKTNEQNPLTKELLITSRSFETGTAGFIPRNFPNPSQDDWIDFFKKEIASYGKYYGVHTRIDAAPDIDGIPEQVNVAYQAINNIEPYVALIIDYKDGPFTNTKGDDLKKAAVSIAKKYKPGYMSIGVELNSFYLFEPASFEIVVNYYKEIYDAIKEVSPNTKVMSNFQLDRMKGETAFTGQNFEPNWHLLKMFEEKLDAVSFTVYPYLNYKTVEEIPEDYLLEIRKYTNKPVFITETGWPSQSILIGVKGSEQEQVDYIKKITKQANDIKVEGIIWVAPHDFEFGEAADTFNHISLLNNDGTQKKAFEYWKAVQSLPLQ